MKGKYVLGDLTFDKKCDAKTYVASWLRQVHSGYVCQPAELASWITPLFIMHPQYSEKTEGWNGRVMVIQNGKYNNFYIEKYGQYESCTISTNVCFDNKLASHENEVRKAFREAVTDQIDAFRSKLFSCGDDVFCAETGVRLLNNSDTHIDHHTRFRELMHAFLRSRCISVNDVHVSMTNGTYATITTMENREIVERWKRFHAEHAVLRPVIKTWNLQNNQAHKNPSLTPEKVKMEHGVILPKVSVGINRHNQHLKR